MDTAEPVELRGFDDFQTRLGDIMRGERATLGKSLLDVQRELKIKATYIAAIENSDPTAFDTPGFVAGYVRSYARYLGMDSEWAYAEFCREGKFTTPSAHGGAAATARPGNSKPAQPAAGEKTTRNPFGNSHLLQPRAAPGAGRLEPGAIGSVLVLLVLIGGLGYGGLAILQQIQRVQLAPVEQSPNVVSDVEPLDPVQGLQAAEASITMAGIEPPTTQALERLYRPETLEVPVVTSRDGPISMVEPGSLGAFSRSTQPVGPPIPGERSRSAETPESVAEAADPADTSAAADPIDDAIAEAMGESATASADTATPGATEIVLVAVDPAWVRVRAADDSVILEKTLAGQETFTLPETDEAPTLRAGNSGAVFFMIDGQTYGPAAPGARVVDDIALDPASLRDRYQRADPEDHQDLARVVASLRSGGPDG